MTQYVTDRETSGVDLEQLCSEMRGIEGALATTVGGGYVIVVFADEHTSEQRSAVDAVLEAHVPGSKHVKLWRYVERRLGISRLDPPTDVDFITGISARLHPTNSIIVDGEVRQTDYYAQATMNQTTGQVTYADLIVREAFAYQRDAAGFARARTQTITWYREDGQAHATTKTRVKLYEPEESLREGQRRRGNILDTLAMTVTGWLMATQTQHPGMQARIQMGRDFFAAHKIPFDIYRDASDAAILYVVRDDGDPSRAWLDQLMAPGLTVRAKIIDDLNIWNLTL